MEATTLARWVPRRLIHLTTVVTTLALIMMFSSGALTVNASSSRDNNVPVPELATQYNGTWTVLQSKNKDHPKGQQPDMITINFSNQGFEVGGQKNRDSFVGTFVDKSNSHFNGSIHNSNLQPNGMVTFTVHPDSGGTIYRFTGPDNLQTYALSGQYSEVNNNDESGSFNLVPASMAPSTNTLLRQFSPRYTGALVITRSDNQKGLPAKGAHDNILFEITERPAGGPNNFGGTFTDSDHPKLSGQIHNGGLAVNGNFTFTVHTSDKTVLNFSGELHPHTNEAISGFMNSKDVAGTFNNMTPSGT